MSLEPTRAQVRDTRAVVQWYLRHYFRKPYEPGTVAMFMDPARVGHFAVERDELKRGEPSALFRLLVATTMFQRRQDVQIMRVLRGISAGDAHELTTAGVLRHLATERAGCERARTNPDLLGRCDLAKDPAGQGTCGEAPNADCYLKRHTVLLKRYGHFGKVPTSIAHAVAESGARDLRDLRRRVLRTTRCPGERARLLETHLSTAWRVSTKIACLFLSAVSNPDLSKGTAPWARGVDWTRFVVIDSNVDLFLSEVGYSGTGVYDARREFVCSLARRIRLDELRPTLRRYNPRLVQQALYVFMSKSNRRSIAQDCGTGAPSVCQSCPQSVQTSCPVR